MAIIERFLARSSNGVEITILVHVPSVSPEWDAEARSRAQIQTLVTSDGHMVTDCGCGCYRIEVDDGEPYLVSRCG